jgi:uncharacterized protein (DUF433 family)
MKPLEVGPFLVVDRRTCPAKLVFKGTRLSAATVLKQLAQGKTFREILTRWPKLTREAVAEAVRLASAALLEKYAAQIRTARESARSGRPPEQFIAPVPVGQFLVVHPRVCHGQLTFDGTRVPVETVLVYLAKGDTLEELRASWPEVTREAIGEAIRLATAALVERSAAHARASDEPAHSGRPA